MTSSLSRQLAKIAASSTNPLDLRAQKNAHSQSLLFDKNVAATQDFDTIYDYCMIGFTELCRLEPEFSTFSNTIFSEASKTRERGQLTASENANLDNVLERFLTLSCRHLLLQPTQKALEWLIRRFRVHELNTETLVLTFLIYHPLPIFSTLLSILPKQLPASLKFLHPYRARLQPIPGHVVQHATNTNVQFFDAWAGYIMKSCRWKYQHEPMLSYWTVRMSCAVEAQIEATKVGSAKTQRNREEDVVRRVTNTIDKCLTFRKAPSIIIGCYIIIERLVLVANLSDGVIATFMDAITSAAVPGVYDEALIGLAMLSQRRKTTSLSSTTAGFLTRLKDIVRRMEEKTNTIRMDSLAYSLATELMQQVLSGSDRTHQEILLQLLKSNLLADRSLKMVVQKLFDIESGTTGIENGEIGGKDDLRQLLLRLIETSNSPRITDIVQNIVKNLKPDREFVSTIRATIEKADKVEEMQAIENGPAQDMIFQTSTSWLDFMPGDADIPASYLAIGSNGAFEKLATAFLQVSGDQPVLEEFLATKPLNKGEANTYPQFVSFLARFWCSASVARSRATAISCVTGILTASQILDLQMLLPYVLTALADPVKAVRTAAVALVMRLDTIIQTAQDTSQIEWSAQQFYGQSEALTLLTLAQLRTIIQVVLVPSLEEMKMDHLAIQQTVCNCLTGSGTAASSNTSEKLKKSSRTTLLKFLADHAEMTPIIRTKLALLAITADVYKAGHLLRFEAFESSLQTWARASEAEIQKACTHEKIQPGSFCDAIIKIVPAASVAGNRLLQKLGSSTASKTFLEATLDHIRISWVLLDSTTQSEWALLFFEHSILHRSSRLLGELSTAILSSLQLSTEILEQFLGGFMIVWSEPEGETSITKRRKLTNGTSLGVKDGDLKVYLTRVISLLDLIRNAGSTAKCNLLPGLFMMFEGIHQSKFTLQNDLNHAHWLLLSCLKEIISAADKSELTKIDHSNIRVDLVVDTLTHTVDPETQYAALLLLSSLANLEPELVVHSMMPVFTFIGSNILKQDNDHATHVVNQTINSVIPPLVASFRRQKGGSLAGVSSLISSFIAAFEHISPHQRLDLFTALVDKLGSEDYLCVVFVILQDRYGDQDAVKDFVSSMLLKHTAAVQFKTVQNCVNVLNDSLGVRPKLLKQIFAVENNQDYERRLILLAKLPSELLLATRLIPKVSKALHVNNADAQTIRSSYAEMVQQVLKMTLQEHKMAQLPSLITTILSTLIGSFPVSESLQALKIVLQQGTEELHQKVLDTFGDTIARAQPGDTRSCDVCYELLPSLISIIESSDSSEVHQNTIRCIGSIIKTYGKVNTSKSLEITQFIAGPLCLQYPNSDTQIAALKALTTMVVVLGEECVPVCPIIISRSLDHLVKAVEKDTWNSELHNAVYSVFGTLLSTISWIITGDKLDQLLELSYVSASNSSDTICDDQRIKTLSLAAVNIDAASLLGALGRSWKKAVNATPEATNEHLRILETSIDKHTKPTIAANAAILIDHFKEIMELRVSRDNLDSEDWDEVDIVDIEDTSSSIFIKVIYKLNDAHFRPLFIRLSEWATLIQGKEQVKTVRRLATWFSFLHKFFSTLQSIVINYTVYVLDAAVDILKKTPLDSAEAKLLWQKTILTLTATFEYDQDDFWKSSARFTDLCAPLITQLQHTVMDEDGEILVPCITAFAVAVESAEYRAEIHARILEHFKSNNPVVRRNLFTCQISLTEALGEEWIALFDSSSTYPVMSEAFEDDHEEVENEARRWKLQIEGLTGESLDTRLQ